MSLKPGERMIDGKVYYSAAWLNDPRPKPKRLRRVK